MSLLFKALAESEGSCQDRKGEGQEGSSVGASGRNGRKELTQEGERPAGARVNSFLPEIPKANAPISQPPPPIQSTPLLTVNALKDKYLAWIFKHRSQALWREAKRHLGRWCQAYGQMEATAVVGAQLEAFQDKLQADDHALMYVKKHATSVRAMYNKGVRMGWLPAACKPFAHVEGIRLDPRPLLEGDLPTREEVHSLLETAKQKPMLHAIVSIYHTTGMRTHELIEARVGDFQVNSKTIVLGKHKRSRTLREPIPRTVHLNAVAYAILVERCRGFPADVLIFPNRAGKPFTSVLLDDMFSRLRKRAGVREGITPYSFRHLYISEMLMAGVDALLVARMAGTSVKMIESTYGHFKTASYQDAQAKLDAMRAGM